MKNPASGQRQATERQRLGYVQAPDLLLLVEVGDPSSKTSGAAREDAYVLWVLALMQVGYPILSVTQLVWNARQSTADTIHPLLSLIKDIGFGLLDSVNKGGLALFVALRATR